MIGKIKCIMEHNSYLRQLVPICRRLGIVHFLHSIKSNIDRIVNRNQRKEFQIFCENHQNDFNQLSEMLEDSFSKETLKQVLKYRKNWKIKELNSVIVKPQYFQSDIFEYTTKEILVDGGAYVGDTVEEFIKRLKNFGGVYQNICMGAG